MSSVLPLSADRQGQPKQAYSVIAFERNGKTSVYAKR